MNLTEAEYQELLNRDVSKIRRGGIGQESEGSASASGKEPGGNLKKAPYCPASNRKAKHANNLTDKTSYLEPVVSNGVLAAQTDTRPHKKYNIHVHHRTNRLADPDGRSIKAAIDGIVEAGLLPEDNASVIGEITQSQEKIIGEEETIITITEL